MRDVKYGLHRLQDKVIVITGAARGQGEAHAHRCAAEGAKVVVTDVLDEQGAAVTADVGPDAMYLSLDVTSEASWDATVAAAIERFGRIDGLVNNAGVVSFAPLVDTTLESYRHQIDVNQVGVFLGMRAVVPHMTHGGSIVNVSSIDGLIGMPGVVAYCASKFAVRGMTKVAALEFASLGIRVNSVHPGLIDTPMLDDPVVQGALGMVMESVPLGRGAAPDEVAAFVAFLLSDESGYVTGAELVIDGGLTAGKHIPLEATA